MTITVFLKPVLCPVAKAVAPKAAPLIRSTSRRLIEFLFPARPDVRALRRSWEPPGIQATTAESAKDCERYFEDWRMMWTGSSSAMRSTSPESTSEYPALHIGRHPGRPVHMAEPSRKDQQ